jgi:hypothetical protein
MAMHGIRNIRPNSEPMADTRGISAGELYTTDVINRRPATPIDIIKYASMVSQ